MSLDQAHPDSATGAAVVSEDTMAQQLPLHFACRVGDLEAVRYLVNVAKHPTDEQDDHDATPLYLAALTGRNEICRFLLESGATCNPDGGGDAARVFYVALTPELRRLLREWSLSARSRNPFLDVLRRAYNDPTHADVVFSAPHEKDISIYLHAVIVKARCPRIAQYLSTTAGSDSLAELRLPAQHCTREMGQLLEYLYTGVLRCEGPGGIETTLVLQKLAQFYHLHHLYQGLETSLGQYYKKRQTQGKHQFRCNVSDASLLLQDMAQLSLRVATPHHDVDSLAELNELVAWSDATIQCQDCNWSVHRVLLCGHSDYFRCALTAGFREAQDSLIDLSGLVPCTDTVQRAIQWFYSDNFTGEEDIVVGTGILLVELGSAILCPRLSAHATNTILIPAVDGENVFELFEVARAHALEKLEERCVETFAQDLEDLSSDARLHTILAREISQIVQAGDVQVTDVPLAAEISSAISNLAGLSCEERSTRLALMQQFMREI